MKSITSNWSQKLYENCANPSLILVGTGDEAHASIVAQNVPDLKYNATMIAVVYDEKRKNGVTVMVRQDGSLAYENSTNRRLKIRHNVVEEGDIIEYGKYIYKVTNVSTDEDGIQKISSKTYYSVDDGEAHVTSSGKMKYIDPSKMKLLSDSALKSAKKIFENA